MGAGGAAELELAKQLAEFGKKETGLDQYSIAKFAESLEVSSHIPPPSPPLPEDLLCALPQRRKLAVLDRRTGLDWYTGKLLQTPE